jgi:hypothetical protein
MRALRCSQPDLPVLQGLAPTIIRNVFHIGSGLVNWLSGFVAQAAAAVVGVVLARYAARRTTLFGGLARWWAAW